MVAITLTQLRNLSDEFGFDYERAKEFLNLNKPKSGRPPKTSGGVVSTANSKPYDGSTIPSTITLKELMKPEKNTGSGTSRGKTGYHYYMNEISDNVKKTLHEKARITGEKVPRNGVASEVSRKWAGLSDSKKDAWNAYAKSQNAKRA